MASIDAWLAEAIEQHRAGRFAEAEALYRRILDANPRHADAWNLLGVAAHQTAQSPLAVERIRQAIAIDPRHAAYYANLGEALRATGAVEEARTSFQRAIELAPNFATAHFNLGLLEMAAGNLVAARECSETAVRLQPADPIARAALGHLGRLQGDLASAVAEYRRALALDAHCLEAVDHLGLTLVHAGSEEEGLGLLRQATVDRPLRANGFYYLGLALKSLGRRAEAMAALVESARLDPRAADPRLALGSLLDETGQLDDAALCYQDVLRLRPGGPEPRHSLGRIYQTQGKLDSAARCYREVLAENPGFGPSHYYLGTVLLSQGHFAEGWNECEWRWHTAVEPRKFSQPTWDGSSPAGRTILVHPEQGLGDTIQFIRYVPLLEGLGARVIVAAPPALVPLLSSSLSGPVVEFSANLPEFDFHAPILSLPRLFGTTATTIPAGVPYLRAAPALVDQWRERLRSIGGFRVGIHWQGNPEYSYDAFRSIPLVEFERLAALPAVSLVSLQQKNGLEQLPRARGRFTIHDLEGDVDQARGAFVDTAAVMRNLDLVVTSDTAAAHLAGALGVPVWLAVSRHPEWRWTHGNDRSAWYPTMRIFRQREWNEWSSVFEAMAGVLANVLARRQMGAAN